MENQANCEELIKKLAEAEKTIEALRNQEVDAIADKKNVLLLQLQKIRDELIKQHNSLDRIYQERLKLMEDLNTRKAELESYTEELRRIRQEAQEARDKYADLYDYAPVGYFTLDKNGVILEANLTAAKLLRLDIKELVQSHITDFIVEDSQDTFHTCVSQTFETGPSQKCELRMRKKDGSIFFGLLESMVKEASDGNLEHIRTIVTDITERKKAEEALKESEDRFKTIFAESPVGIELYDADGGLINVNKACLDIFGTSEDEVKGFNLFDDPNVTEEVKSKLRRGEMIRYEALFDFGKVRKYNLYRTSKNGLFELEVSITPLTRNGMKKVYGYLVQVQNITERKKAAERYKTVVRTAMDGFWLTDIKGCFLDVNDSYCDLIGYSRAELLKMSITDVEAAETSEETVSHLRRIVATGHDRFETRHRRKDGQLVEIEVSVNFMDLEGGRFFVFLRDITERKKVEQDLKESEERFRTLANNISQLSWMADEKGWIFWYNQRWYDHTGTTLEEMEGWGWQKVHRPDYVHKVTEKFKHSLETGEAWEDTFPLRGKDGNYRWFLSRAIPIRDAQGNVVRWFGTNTDITEQRQTEESLRNYSRKLEEANNDLQQFAYVTSHDLREPLRIITGFSQSLAKRYKDKLDQRANEYIDFIVDATARMQNLIDDILAYSRVGTRSVPFEPVEMEKVLQNTLANLKMSIEESKATITHDPLPVVQGDPNQMLQVLQNLIANAIKFRRKEEPLFIHISAGQAGEEWIFSVKDNGIGIDPELFGRLFVLFSRLHTQEEYPGTGVGLAITKRIIQRHNGRIWVESQPGKGSTFYFSLPVKITMEEYGQE